MLWALTIVCCILTVEIFERARILSQVKKLTGVYSKSLRVVTSKNISDHWKERVLPAYSLRIFSSSLLILVLVLLALSPFALAALAVKPTGLDLISFLSSPMGLVGTTAIVLTYASVRARLRPKRSKKEGMYGPMDRMLHHLALGSNMVQEVSFIANQALAGRLDVESVKGNKHVFISGLARAGTTALLRLFYSTGEFSSLTYRDMPFPLAPHLWGMLQGFSARKAEAAERAHGDGMLVDFDSPEALEEVFWRTFSGESYIRPEMLMPMHADSETVRGFRKYIAIIISKKGPARYLSKNNNNILRLPSIREAFPESLILVPYRDPKQQALSLWEQHRRFVEVQGADSFAKKYMGWLVHHEFGSDHRPFGFEDKATRYSPEEPGYWLIQWVRAYHYLLSLNMEKGLGLIFVDYEGLCDDSEAVWVRLSQMASLHGGLPAGFRLVKARPRTGPVMDDEVLSGAYRIHSELKERFNQMLKGG